MITSLFSKISMQYLKIPARRYFNKNPAPEKRKGEVEPSIIIDDQPLMGPTGGLNNEEKSNDYSKLVVQINERWRVIVCRDDIQWILQSRKGSYKGRPAWRGKSFCRTKEGLLSHIREKLGIKGVNIRIDDLPLQAQIKLNNLPNRLS